MDQTILTKIFVLTEQMIPRELFEIIFSNLKVKDIINFQLSCVSYYNLPIEYWSNRSKIDTTNYELSLRKEIAGRAEEKLEYLFKIRTICVIPLIKRYLPLSTIGIISGSIEYDNDVIFESVYNHNERGMESWLRRCVDFNSKKCIAAIYDEAISTKASHFQLHMILEKWYKEDIPTLEQFLSLHNQSKLHHITRLIESIPYKSDTHRGVIFAFLQDKKILKSSIDYIIVLLCATDDMLWDTLVHTSILPIDCYGSTVKYVESISKYGPKMFTSEEVKLIADRFSVKIIGVKGTPLSKRNSKAFVENAMLKVHRKIYPKSNPPRT